MDRTTRSAGSEPAEPPPLLPGRRLSPRVLVALAVAFTMFWTPLQVSAIFTVLRSVGGNLFGTSSCFHATVNATQNGTFTNTTSGTQSVSISSVDPTKAFLQFSTSSNSNRPVGSAIRGRIANATTLEFARVTNESSPATITVQWYVVEYSCGVSVQRGAVTQSTNTTNVPVSAVNTSRSFLGWSKTVDSTENDWNSGDQTVGELTSSSNVQFRSQGPPTSTTAASGPWYNAAWQHRKSITIDHTKVTADQTNFPVLVSLSGDTDLSAGAQSTGNDILFTSSDAITKLSHEIGSYSSGTLTAWVNVPLLSSTADTVLYMYYGNASAADQSDVANVFDTNYKAVWHLNESINTNANNFKDSSPVGTNTGTLNTGTPAATQANPGKIGTGVTFNAGNIMYTNTQQTGSGPQLFTIECWFNGASLKTFFNFEGSQTANNNGLYDRALWVGNDSKVHFTLYTGSSTVTATATAIGMVSGWHHVVATYDSSSGTNNMKVYVDGGSLGQGTASSAQSGSGWWRLGGYQQNTNSFGSSSGYYSGSVDEARVSNMVRSSTWISTEYNNQNSPSTFYAAGTEETTSGGGSSASWYNSAWQYRKAVTIDHTQVTANQSNFPVLVSFSDSNVSAGAQSTGNDILFTSSDGATKLSHEINSYSAGTLTAWVKVPTLSSTADTVLYMYYGNASAADQSDVANVFDTNYKAVWHLNESVNTTANNFKDSSPVGTNTGTLTTSTPAATRANPGKIGTGVTFNAGNIMYTNTQQTGSGPQLFTIECWFNGTSLKTFFNFEGSQTANNNGLYDRAMWLGNDNKAHFTLYTGSSTVTATATATGLNSGWHHVVATYDSSGGTNNMKVYVDGGSLGQGTASSAQSGSGWWRLGGYQQNTNSYGSSAGYYSGSVDEARVSNMVRSSTWISTEYNNQSAPGTFASVGAQEAAPTVSWYNNSWAYRKAITVDRTKVGADQTNFPVLVNLTDANLSANAQSTGNDILFTSAAGVKLDHQIESYTSGTGALTAWVRVPTLSSSADTTLYMYYGNAGAASQQNATGVWDANYKAVWHLGEAVSATAGAYKDSTSNANNATYQGTPGMTQAAGQVNGSVTLDGSNDYLSTTAASATVPNTVTVQAWFKTSTASGTKILSYEDTQTGTTSSNYDRMIYIGTDNKAHYSVYSGGVNYTATSATVTGGVWHHLVGVEDFAGQQIRLYLDGVLTTLATSGTPQSYSGWWRMGSYQNYGGYTGGAAGYFPGSIDEARVSTVARSGTWVTTEYNNQSSPSTFYSVGGQESRPLAWYNNAWTYRKTITIDHTKVTANQTDFPVLISATDANLASYAQSTGNDIVFTSVDGQTKLDHQIESYTAGTGALTAWVRVPTLSSTTDTTLFMYYGNAAASNQQNATGVWDANYKGVWHLSEAVNTTAGNFKDSTSNTDNATYQGTPGMTQGTGKVNGSLTLDGSNDYLSTANQLTNPQVYTVEAWAKTSTASGKIIATYEGNQTGTGSSTYDRMIFIGTDGKADFGLWDGTNTQDAHGSTNVANNAWHHIVGTYNSGTTALNLYVDGALAGSGTSSSAEAANGYVRIGAYQSDHQYGANGYYPGQVDEVRVSTAARSSTWIATEYNNMNSPGTFASIGSQEAQSTGTAVTHTIWWQLVSFDNPADINVQRGTTSLTGSNLTTAVTLSTAVDLSHTFALVSYGSSAGGTDIGARMLRARLTGTTTLTIDRAVSGTPDPIEDIAWQVVELKDGSRVRSGNASFAASTATVTPTIQAVDTTRATAFASTLFGAGASAGSTSYVADDILGAASATVAVASATQVSLTRANTAAAADISWYVVEWGGPRTWNAAYPYRQKIAVDASTAAPNGYSSSVTFNHATLVTAGQAQADGDDVRVVYWSGSTWTELDRILDGSSAWNSGTTKLWFKTQAAIGANAEDDGYYLHYGNPSAASPPATAANVWTFTDGFEAGNLNNWTRSGAAWYNASWRYRMKITIDHTKVSTADQSNFPVLISITDATFPAKIQSDADDVLFTDYTGTGTKLDHQIESFNTGTGELIAWVRIGTLSFSTDTVIYMYYGNATTGTNQNATAVWDTNYKAVWHLGEAVNTTDGNFKDSTSNGYNMSYQGTPGMAQAAHAGMGGNGLLLDGSDDYLSATTGQASASPPTTLTLEAWVKTSTASGKKIIGYESSKTGASSTTYDRQMYAGTDGYARYTYNDTVSGYRNLSTATTVSDGTNWHHVAFTQNPGSITSGYVDGNLTSTLGSTSSYRSFSGYWRIGSYATNTTNFTNSALGYIPASIDEIRVSNVVRSNGWITTEYRNINSPSTFYTLAAEDDLTVPMYAAANDRSRTGGYSLRFEPHAAVDHWLVANAVNEPDLLFESYWWTPTVGTGLDTGMTLRNGSANSGNDYEAVFTQLKEWKLYEKNNNTPTTLYTGPSNATCPAADNAWHKMTLIVTGTSMKSLCDDVQQAPGSGWTATGSDFTTGSLGFRAWRIPAGKMWVDDITARRYVTPEPATTLGIVDYV